ncbi:MAG: 2-oxoacid:acceptor oxidoreductase family protein, partial [Candidatus Natronoplasma sp.]
MVKSVDMILGGAQGAGLETTVQILSNALASSGLGIIADREYYSNIKGRHSYVHAKVSSEEIPSSLDSKLDTLGCMDAETLFTHFDDLREGGYLIYDISFEDKTQDDIKSIAEPLRKRLERRYEEIDIEGTAGSIVDYLKKEKDVTAVALDYPSILERLGKKYEMSSSQASRYVSSILIGAVSGLVDLDKDLLGQAIRRKFEGKEKIAEQNIFLVEEVLDKVREEYDSSLRFDGSSLEEDEVLMVNGNEMTGMGKITAGMRFQSYYPITPAADESFFIEEHGGEEEDVLVLQTEDELAAVTSCIGAALTGTRSATATSGPGFALMTEGLGWAAMNEVPVVITYYQRGGPSTGLPTRGSQEDLLNALFASHGDLPRIVLA